MNDCCNEKPLEPCAPPRMALLHRVAWFIEAVASAVRSAANVKDSFDEVRGRRYP